jgi:hypothetical protein
MDKVPTVYASEKPVNLPAMSAAATSPMMPAPFMPATVSDSITLADPTFVRPSAGAVTSCPPSGNPTTHYKLYEFNLAGCAVASPVTIDTCASGIGLDTNIFIYRQPSGAPSTALSPTFSPGSPCTNVIASNNNNAACGAGSVLSSVTTPMSNGNFVVVVTTNGANQTGNFTLNVTSAGCVVTQVASCNPTVSPTESSFLAAGGTGTANVAIGPVCAWTAVSNDAWINITSGSAGSGNGTVQYSVTANPGEARVGSMTIAGQTFPVTQEAGAVTVPCIHDALVTANPTYVRPSVSAAGVVSCPVSGNPTTRYKYYEFDLAGCPSGAVTINTCGTGACAAKPAGTLTDTIVTVYRKSDGSGTSPGSPIFTPGSPCLNAVTGNNNSNLCGAGSTLSSVTSTLPSGRFGVVVTTNAADQLGTFNLSVTAPGCTVTMVPACSSVSGTVTPNNQTVCPGSSANISVGVSGGTAPYTVSLNNGGGTMNGAGPFTFTVSPASTTTYTATGSDANGCPITMSGTATVTVSDTTAPTVTCPVDSSASADASCQAAVPNYAAAATTSDNCGGAVTVTQSPAAGTLVGLGPHPVTVTATDGSGNSSTCTTTFTVNDTTAPTVTCPANSSASADATTCQAAVPNYAAAATASDNCGPVTKTQSPAAGTMVGPGPHTVTVTATDGAGNSSTCTTTFTVNDTTAPTVSCPADSSASAGPSCTAPVPNYAGAATTSDNCGPVTVSQSPAAGTPVGLGPHTVTVTATDGAGNSSSCTTTFTVNDLTAPSVSCPADSSASADASCQAPVPNYAAAATASDNCGPVTVSQSPAAGTPVGVGPHTVTVTATDGSGNSSSCTTTFTVNDTMAPIVSCPANSSASADSSCQAAVPNYAAAATASDNCGPVTKTQSPAAGTMVGLGPHTVTVTATDGAGNSSTCTTTFTVNDTTAPTVSCPANSSASADASCMAAVPNYASAATASDNCGPVTKSQSPAAGTMVGLGPHTVTVTATDGAGNSSSCTTTFTVNDTTAPVITCPANIVTPAGSGSCSASLNPGTATATDNCDATPTITGTRSDGKPLTDPYSGVVIITWTATDDSGNSSSCMQTVTVTDTQGPVITVNNAAVTLWPPNHQYVNFNLSQFVTGASDNCDSGVDINDVVIVSVTSDELEDNPSGGDGNTLNDIVIAANCKSVQLRSERDGNLNGRVYTITFVVVDAAGNVGTASVKVTVPKSQNGAGAIDDGPKYTVNGTCP